MKKLILVLAAVALCILAGLATLAVMYRYHNYQTEQTLRAEKAKADVASSNARTKALFDQELQSLRSDVTRLQGECKKGTDAYNLLTPYYQAKTPAPEC